MRLQDSEFFSNINGPGSYAVHPFSKKTDEMIIQKSFQEIMEQSLQVKNFSEGNVTFSKHAKERLQARGIQMTESQLNRLDDGTKLAREKGIKDSLVVVDQLAFIVNVPNQTVVTAMDQTQVQTNAFTNIDGAVFV